MSTDDQSNPRGVQRSRPDTVDALASTVISVLRGRQATSLDGLRQFVLDHILRAILHPGAFVPDAVLIELRGYRLTVDAIIDLYVPTAARLLGDKWEDDRINFAQVTVGAMRLQSLLAEASAEATLHSKPSQNHLTGLVLIPQGEQHFLGASVLAGQLRRLGCDVNMSYDEDFGSLSARLVADMPDMILITSARRETLESVANTVQIVRKISPQPPLLVVGGAMQVPAEDVIELTGADLVTNVADEAVAHCVKRMKSQKVK